MRFTLVTLFPEFFDSPLAAGLFGKARASGVVEAGFLNPRDFATDRHKTVDDRPYGGGPGMVMLAGPMSEALRSLGEGRGRTIYLSPRGRRLDQGLARELAREEAVTLICGRYEGVDERVLEAFGIEEVSVGDFVLNGGETAALCVLESVARLIPGFMGKIESGEAESFSGPHGDAPGLLEHPHYTRPEVFEGRAVPPELLGGDHAKVAVWRRRAALAETLGRRPELLAENPLSPDDLEFLRKTPRTRPGRNLRIILAHWPALVKNEGGDLKVGATSLTNLDLHDMARVSRSYGLGACYAVTPLADQQELARRLIGHWTGGPGGRANADRAEALGLLRVAGAIEDALTDIERETGAAPRLVVTSAKPVDAKESVLPPGFVPGLGLAQVRAALDEAPVVLLFGTGHGLAPQALSGAWGALKPVRPYDEYNHLSVRAAMAVIVDRILGDVL